MAINHQMMLKMNLSDNVLLSILLCASLNDDDYYDDDDDDDGDVVLTWQCASFEAPSLCHLH